MADSAVVAQHHVLRDLFWSVFLPATLFGVGMGAAAPIVALAARNLGAPVWLAALAVALCGLGMVFGDLPSGVVVARIGERKALILATVVGTAGAGLCLVAPTVLVLCVGVFSTGIAYSVWGLARQSYLTAAVPLSHRARAMSTFGLTFRIGNFAGPIVGAAIIALVGVRGGFAVQLVGILVAGVLMARRPDPDGAQGTGSHTPIGTVVARNRLVLSTLGVGSVLLGAARAAMPIVIPLWADHLGFSASTASLVYATAAAVDVVCAYPAGYLMDRFGRSFVAVPSLVVLGVGYAAVGLATSLPALVAVAVVFGVGNGFGNGVIMTMGADTAPADSRPEYLAVWRLTHDVGWFAGPLAISALATVLPLSLAIAALGGVSWLGGAIFARYLPRFTPAGRPRS